MCGTVFSGLGKTQRPNTVGNTMGFVTGFLLIASPVLVAVAVLLIRDRIFDRRYTHEELAESARSYARRLFPPDWAFYERHLERPVSFALRELFADQRLVIREFLEDDEWLSFKLSPVDEHALVDTRRDFRLEVIPFMRGEIEGEDDILFLRPGQFEPNTVYVAFWEKMGDRHYEVFASSIDEFVQRLHKSGLSPTNS
jgi:hypothetical protein